MTKKIKSISEIMGSIKQEEKKKQNVKINPFLSHMTRSGHHQRIHNISSDITDYERARVIKDSMKKRGSDVPRNNRKLMRDAKKKYNESKKSRRQNIIAVVRQARKNYIKDKNVFEIDIK